MEHVVKSDKNIDVHFIKTDNFRENTLNLYIRSELKDNNNFLHTAMLMRLLFTSSKKYDNTRLVKVKLEELYNTSFNFNVSAVSNNIIVEISMDYINDKYIDEDLSKECIDFFTTTLFEPNMINNKFSEKEFEKVKNIFIDGIDISKDDTREEARKNLYSFISDDIELNYSNYTKEDVLNVKQSDLVNKYYELINEDSLALFILGDIDINTEYKYLSKAFNTINNERFKKYEVIPYNYTVNNKELQCKTIIDNELSQSHLMMSLSLNDLTKYERLYVLPIYNLILGGNASSFLFNIVREEHNLCYSVYSTYVNHLNLIRIYSGVSPENVVKAKDLIVDIVQSIKQASFEKELENAKLALITSFDQSKNSSDFLIYDCYLENYRNIANAEERLENFKKVTKEDIINVCDKIKLGHCIIMTNGEDNEN